MVNYSTYLLQRLRTHLNMAKKYIGILMIRRYLEGYIQHF
uniref:Uncharacterized protein n=1 Tax=virus sp. ctBM815 TaxID=2825806 RepID=A0A8S5RJU8_9VIRU|nr:MAG TPA: hypothetical protein [virus sp. ctBM815]DAJ65336.1 MAG TPA: hypothetical protein [Bacteriophage sp.]